MTTEREKDLEALRWAENLAASFREFDYHDDAEHAERAAQALQLRAAPSVPEISPDELLSVARRTGLREHLHALNPTDARAILARYVAAIDAHRAQRKENGNGD